MSLADLHQYFTAWQVSRVIKITLEELVAESDKSQAGTEDEIREIRGLLEEDVDLS